MANWTLGWRHHVKRTEISTSYHLITYVIRYRSEDACRSNLEALRAWLQEAGFSPIAPLATGQNVDERKVIAVLEKGSIIAHFGKRHGDDILVRCTVGKLKEDMGRFIEDNWWHYDVEFACELPHGREKFTLKGVKASGTVYTGVVDRGEQINLYPYKFFEVRQAKALIAKALVSYYNYEICESAPTIELVEVQKEFRGKGIGKKLVAFIEKDAEDTGFDQIWATDAGSSISFWEHLGYEMDLDEGVKYLG